MIIYNVTSQVTPEIEKIWIEWMEKCHLPKVFATNYFEDISILKVSMDQPSDPTFAVQYKANSNQALKEYLDKDAPFHKNEIRQKFGEQVLFFETYLELVSKLV